MQQLLKYLRGLGPLGSLVANLVMFVTTNWPLTMSAALGLVVALWSWATNVIDTPAVRAGVTVFLLVLWTFIGLSLWRNRRTATRVVVDHDFSHGLWMESVSMGFEQDNEPACLQLTINVRNVSQVPLWFKMEKFDVIVANRAIGRKTLPDITVRVPRVAVRGFRHPAFKRDDLREFIGQTVEGSIEFSMLYGRIGQPFTRRLRTRLDTELRLTDKPSYGDSIVEEIDEPI